MDCGLQSEAVACLQSGLSCRRESRQRLGNYRPGADRALGPVRFRTWCATWSQGFTVARIRILRDDRLTPLLPATGFTHGGRLESTGIRYRRDTSRSQLV